MTACIPGFVTGKGQKAKGSSPVGEMCETPGQRSGQKDASGGRIIAFVSYAIPASCTTHIGPPPYPLHTPSTPLPYSYACEWLVIGSFPSPAFAVCSGVRSFRSEE